MHDHEPFILAVVEHGIIKRKEHRNLWTLSKSACPCVRSPRVSNQSNTAGAENRQFYAECMTSSSCMTAVKQQTKTTVSHVHSGTPPSLLDTGCR